MNSASKLLTECAQQVSQVLKPGQAVDFLWMLHLSDTLQEGVHDLYDCANLPDAAERREKTAVAIIKIMMVAAILRRFDVEGSVVAYV